MIEELPDEEERAEVESVLIKYELPMKKLVPRALYHASKSPLVMVDDDTLIRAATPDSIDWRLRIRYNSLLQKLRDETIPIEQRVIRIENVIDGITTYPVWQRRVGIEAKAVFYTKKIGSYLEDQDALLTAMSARLWEIASAPLMKDGELDLKAASMVHKTIMILLDRKFGQAVQRTALKIEHQDISHLDPSRLELDISRIEALNGGKD